MPMTDEQKEAWLAQKKALPDEKKAEILDALIEFTADASDMTPDEIDEAIREAGLDPEKVGSGLLARLRERLDQTKDG